LRELNNKWLIIVSLTLFIISLNRFFYGDKIYLTDWALNLSIFFGILAIALAIGFGIGKRIKDSIQETRRGLIDEKIAMMYGYVNDVNSWKARNINVEYMTERIIADIRSVGRIKHSVKDKQKENLKLAGEGLQHEMTNEGYTHQSSQLNSVFNSYFEK